MKTTISPSPFISSWNAISGNPDRSKSLALVGQLLDKHAVAVKLHRDFYQTDSPSCALDSILVPLDDGVQRLIAARSAVMGLNSRMKIFACTEARVAVAVTSDSDKRDHKYLSGLISREGNHVYCGGLEAAIDRGLMYAPYSDVVCYKSNTANIAEAKKFVSAIRAEFPGKELAFGYCPKPDGPRLNEMDHQELGAKLQGLGYDYYFLSQCGSSVFPQFPPKIPWVMFDDVLRGQPFTN